MAVEVFHPDGVEDGYVTSLLRDNFTWAQLRASDGNSFNYAAGGMTVRMVNDDQVDRWRWLDRIIIMFPTFTLPPGIFIILAVLSVRGYEKLDETLSLPDINVYSSDPAATDKLESADFTTLGDTPFCDTPIAYADFDAAGWNDFILNAAGIAAISKTGVTKFGLRLAKHDAEGNQPNWVADTKQSVFSIRTAEEPPLGTFAPVLTVTYATVPAVTTDPASDIVQELATLNGTLDDDGDLACTCGFEWGETISYGNTTPTDSKVTGESFSQVIAALERNKTYHFRAFATNAAGTRYGADRSFTTHSETPINKAYALARCEL